MGIVGPNGVGKSTLLRIIMGEEAPDSGKVVVGDTVVFWLLFSSQHRSG